MATPPPRARRRGSCGTSCLSSERSRSSIPVNRTSRRASSQLLREKETLLEEVAARDRTVATLENQLGDSEKKVVFLERHLSKLDPPSSHCIAMRNRMRPNTRPTRMPRVRRRQLSRRSPYRRRTSLVARDELDIARAALQGAEAREKEVRDERDKALQRCDLLMEEKRSSRRRSCPLANAPRRLSKPGLWTR